VSVRIIRHETAEHGVSEATDRDRSVAKAPPATR
jgi:hypothetical protein